MIGARLMTSAYYGASLSAQSLQAMKWRTVAAVLLFLALMALAVTRWAVAARRLALPAAETTPAGRGAF